MTLELLLIKQPSIGLAVFFALGALYFCYVLIRNHQHFHWNLFAVGIALLAIGFLVNTFNLFYTSYYIGIVSEAAIALSAAVFAITAYIATKGDKNWRS